MVGGMVFETHVAVVCCLLALLGIDVRMIEARIDSRTVSKLCAVTRLHNTEK